MSNYIPSRLQAPRPVRKACRDCKEVKPNDFKHFGKKWNGTRTDYTTVDVCLACRNAKISQGMRKRWAEKFEEDQLASDYANAVLLKKINDTK